jgi:hypothetical protein
MAALLKNRDGQPLSSSYFNYLERDRGKPPDHLLEQMAEILKVGPDVLYFWAKRVPPDPEPDEYGHLLLHARLYEHFRGQIGNPAPLRCYSRTVEGNIDRLTDWMEWQAGYFCGALLMPKRRVDLLAGAFAQEHGGAVPLKRDSIDGGRLIERVTDLFDVSRDAARVRLLKLGHLAA